MRPFAVNANFHKARIVLGIWAVLLLGMITALVLLNLNSIRVINNIEYVQAGRYQGAMTIYAEATKHAIRVLSHSAELNAPSDKKTLISQDDPDYTTAVNLYQRAFALDPRGDYVPDIRRHYENLAQIYAAGGDEVNQIKADIKAFMCVNDYKNAENFANALTTRMPNDYEAWMLLADIYLHTKNISAANLAIERMESASGPPAVVKEWRGRMALAQGNTADAERYYKAAIELNPRNIEARKKLSSICLNSQKSDQAAKVLADGVVLGGSSDANYMHLYGGLLLGLNQNQDALKALQTAASLERNSGDVRWDLARAYQRLGKTARANAAFQDAIRLKPDLQKRALEK
ncbi:MAG: tetratricopeptide repeat protein [bacterium]